MIDKCSKKDCVDFDIPANKLDLGMGACVDCKYNRQNPAWPNDPDEYLKVENIVDPIADISAITNVMKGVDDSIIIPAVNAMEALNREAGTYPVLPFAKTAPVPYSTPIPTMKDRRSTDCSFNEADEISEETYDLAKDGYTIRKDLVHNEAAKDIKDSGKRTEFETGAVRDAQGGKGRFDLQPLLALWALAHHIEKGCEKYGDRNWEKGIPIKNFIDSAERHLKEFQLGLTDENHMAAALWNIACCYETLVRIDMGILPRSLDQDIPYILRGVVKNSEEIKPWDRLHYPLREAK